MTSRSRVHKKSRTSPPPHAFPAHVTLSTTISYSAIHNHQVPDKNGILLVFVLPESYCNLWTPHPVGFPQRLTLKPSGDGGCRYRHRRPWTCGVCCHHHPVNLWRCKGAACWLGLKWARDRKGIRLKHLSG